MWFWLVIVPIFVALIVASVAFFLLCNTLQKGRLGPETIVENGGVEVKPKDFEFKKGYIRKVLILLLLP